MTLRHLLLLTSVTTMACAHTLALAPVMPAGTGAVAIVQDDATSADRAVLHRTASRVDPKDPSLPLLVARMEASLEESKGVGIAAPQIGVPARVFLIKHGTRPKGGPTRVAAYVNPEVEWLSPDVDRDYEACLSVTGVGGLVPRARAVRFSYDAVGGGRHTLELTDWDARIFQHEFDHIDGHLYVERREGESLPIDEMRRRRDEGHKARGWLPEE